MSRAALSTLSIEHFRGAVLPFHLSFERGKKLTVIYGENGSGKTTICDALEFAAKGTIGSLEDRGLGGGTKSYWPALGKRSGDVLVRLETTDSTCTTRLRGRDVIVELTGERPRVEILRRNQMTKLLEAPPSERYKEIARFIDVGGIEASENALKRLLSDLEKNRDEDVAAVDENQGEIRRSWELAGRPGADPFSWAEAETGRNRSEEEAFITALGELRIAFQSVSAYPDRFEVAAASERLAHEEADAITRQLQDALTDAVEGAAELAGVLEAAKSYLARHPDLERCPLCQSREKVTKLRESVEERLAQFERLQTAKRKKTAADQHRDRVVGQLDALRLELARESERFEEVRAKHKRFTEIAFPAMAAPSTLGEIGAWIAENFPVMDSWSNQEQARRDHRARRDVLKKALTVYRRNLAEQKDLDELLPQLKRALDIVGEERRRFTDEALRAIAVEVERLYEAVHPEEGFGKVALELDPRQRASLKIGATFVGKIDAPPQAYWTVSRIWTRWGYVSFSRMASLDDPQSTILVLDDVLASVDEPHVDLPSDPDARCGGGEVQAVHRHDARSAMEREPAVGIASEEPMPFCRADEVDAHQRASMRSKRSRDGAARGPSGEDSSRSTSLRVIPAPPLAVVSLCWRPHRPGVEVAFSTRWRGSLGRVVGIGLRTGHLAVKQGGRPSGPNKVQRARDVLRRSDAR